MSQLLPSLRSGEGLGVVWGMNRPDVRVVVLPFQRDTADKRTGIILRSSS